MNPTAVLSFWFEEIDRSSWFKKDTDFDAEILARFGEYHRAATEGELLSWRVSAEGRLAEILVLDQFSRNMFRDTPAAFASDGLALILSQEAVRCCADRDLDASAKAFLYMPYMHSESRLIHRLAVQLFDQPGLEDNLRFEHHHREIIERFGRYPHRNTILGRESTPEELEFLAGPGSSF